nr:hypothetical protein [Desulfobacterales bacterium]
MIRPVLIGLQLIFGLFFLTGCASWGGLFPGSSAVDPKPTMAALAERAAFFEAADEIQMALLCWRNILNFDPDDPEALANFERLERSATQRAQDAYLEGEKALGASHP